VGSGGAAGGVDSVPALSAVAVADMPLFQEKLRRARSPADINP
jgi:hypothetical protein